MGRRTMNPWSTIIQPRLLEITAWARDGATDLDIATRLGIARSCLARYKAAEPTLQKALAEGKAPVDISVENSLLKRARGFEYEEVTSERIAGGGMRITKKVKKYMPPDVAACIIWLKNRLPEKWRDKQINQEEVEDLSAIREEVFGGGDSNEHKGNA